MRFGDSFADGKTDTQTSWLVGQSFTQLAENGEQEAALICRYAGTMILDLEADQLFSLSKLDANLAALRPEIDRIVDQGGDRFGNQFDVAAQGQIRARELSADRNLLVQGLRMKALDYMAGDDP